MFTKAAQIFKSGVNPKRTCEITGRVVRIRNPRPNSFSFLIVPNDDYYSKAGLWLNGYVPMDRNPRYSAFKEIRTGSVYTFLVSIGGNQLKLPDRPDRVNLDIIRFWRLAKDACADCNAEFCVSGSITAVCNSYIVLQSRPLPENTEHPPIPGRYMSFYTPNTGLYYPGQKVCLHVHLQPGIQYVSGRKYPQYNPRLRILEMVDLSAPVAKKPATVSKSKPVKQAEPVNPEDVIEYTTDRRGHWRTSKNGVRHWVRQTVVHLQTTRKD